MTSIRRRSTHCSTYAPSGSGGRRGAPGGGSGGTLRRLDSLVALAGLRDRAAAHRTARGTSRIVSPGSSGARDDRDVTWSSRSAQRRPRANGSPSTGGRPSQPGAAHLPQRAGDARPRSSRRRPPLAARRAGPTVVRLRPVASTTRSCCRPSSTARRSRPSRVRAASLGAIRRCAPVPSRRRPRPGRWRSCERWAGCRVPVPLDVWSAGIVTCPRGRAVRGRACRRGHRGHGVMAAPRLPEAVRQRLLHDRTSRRIQRAIGSYPHVDVADVPLLHA